MRHFAMRHIIAVLLLGLTATGWAQEPPLPELDELLARVRARLEDDDARQAGWAYVETRREMKLDGSGRVTDESVKVFESYPGLPGQGRWNRLIEEDGVPLSAEALAEQDEQRRRDAERYLERNARQSEADRARRARDRERRRQRQADRIDDVFTVFDGRIEGRALLNGHRTIVLSLTPDPDAKTKSDVGKWMRHFAVRVWVSEAEHELVRVEAEALRDVTIGAGLLARVHKGATALFERTKVGGERWLPVRSEYTVSGRVLLLKRLRQRGVSEYSGYRRFTVDTTTVLEPPASLDD